MTKVKVTDALAQLSTTRAAWKYHRILDLGLAVPGHHDEILLVDSQLHTW